MSEVKYDDSDKRYESYRTVFDPKAKSLRRVTNITY